MTVMAPATVNIDDLLRTLVRLPVVCPRHRLAASVELAWDDLDGVLEEAEDLGLLEAWDEAPGELAIVLTPLAAERLQVEIAELEDGVERWQPIGIPLKPLKRLPSRERAESDILERPDDPRATKVARDPQSHEPVLELIAVEVAEVLAANLKPPKPQKPVKGAWRWFDDSRGRTPYPRFILGMTLQWPVLWVEGEICPACHNRELDVSEACLICYRSGIDHLLSSVLDNQKPRPYVDEEQASLPVACPDDPGYVGRDGVKVPERFARLMKG